MCIRDRSWITLCIGVAPLDPLVLVDRRLPWSVQCVPLTWCSVIARSSSRDRLPVVCLANVGEYRGSRESSLGLDMLSFSLNFVYAVLVTAVFSWLSCCWSDGVSRLGWGDSTADELFVLSSWWLYQLLSRDATFRRLFLASLFGVLLALDAFQKAFLVYSLLGLWRPILALGLLKPPFVCGLLCEKEIATMWFVTMLWHKEEWRY